MKRPRLRLRRGKHADGETAATAAAATKQAPAAAVKPTPAGATGAAAEPNGAPRPGGPAAAAAAPKLPGVPRTGDTDPGKAAAVAEAKRPPEGAPPAPVDPHERIDGLRAWLADVERKLAIRTYALGAATVLALAAGIVAIVLLLGLREDSATNEDVEALNERIGLVQQEAESAVEAQLSEVAGEVETLQQRVSRLADEGTATDRDIQVLEGDLDDLREQLVDLEDEVERTAQAAERAEQQAAESSNQADDDAADANP